MGQSNSSENNHNNNHPPPPPPRPPSPPPPARPAASEENDLVRQLSEKAEQLLAQHKETTNLLKSFADSLSAASADGTLALLSTRCEKKLRHRLDVVQRQLQPTPALLATSSGAAAGMATFFGCKRALTGVAHVCRLSSNNKLLASLSGAVFAAASAGLAGHVMMYTTVYIYQQQTNEAFPLHVPKLPARYLKHFSMETREALHHAAPLLFPSPHSRHLLFEDSFPVSDIRACLHPWTVLTGTYVVCGLVQYRLLGGKWRYFAPSDVIRKGTFYRQSLPATWDYADASSKRILQEFGSKYGCHHCGVGQGGQSILQATPTKFIADHIPPVKYSKMSGDDQEFLPQCEDCSSKQSHAVRMDKRKLIFPRSVRSYDFWLPFPVLLGFLIFYPLSEEYLKTIWEYHDRRTKSWFR